MDTKMTNLFKRPTEKSCQYCAYLTHHDNEPGCIRLSHGHNCNYLFDWEFYGRDTTATKHKKYTNVKHLGRDVLILLVICIVLVFYLATKLAGG